MIAPTWFRPWMAWLAVTGALVSMAGWQTVRLVDERTAHAMTKAAWSDERTSMERQAREAVEAARKEEQRRTAAVQEIADEAQKQLDAATADAGAARDAGERLRKQVSILTAAVRGGACKESASAEASTSADASIDLLERLQQRLDDAADRIAEFADQSNAAGLACERSYDALTPAARGGLGLKR